MQQNSKKLAKNTAMLTVRMLFLLLINLYASRILLSNLGIQDYGIYNVVGGVVSMFSIVSNSITASITRFITFELGKGDEKRLSEVFSTAVFIQIFLSFIVLLFLETIGLWFLNTQLVIPDNRMYAANWVFQFSALTFLVNLISVPYNASIISHERMKAFAFISIFEGVVKLFIVLSISLFQIDNLIYYGLSLCILSIIIRLIYGIYCEKHFKECMLRWIFNRKLIKEMFSFAGWNFIGAASGLLRDQGGNIVLNMFCGPFVNAARGIAYQVSNAVHGFVSGFTTSLNPQITKSYASKDTEYMMKIIFAGSKFSFYILFILSVPILFNTSFIVNLWLGQMPDYSISFIRLVLILNLSEIISMPLITVMLATGNIKKYQIIVGGLNMLNLPISYFLLRLEFQPESVFFTGIIISQICLFARLILLRKMVKLQSKKFLKEVYFKLLLVCFISCSITFIFTQIFNQGGLGNFIIISLISISSTLGIIWGVGLSTYEKNKILSYAFIIKEKFIIR